MTLLELHQKNKKKDLKVIKTLETSGTCQVYLDGNVGIGTKAVTKYDLKTNHFARAGFGTATKRKTRSIPVKLFIRGIC